MKKMMKPGDMFNKFQEKKGKKVKHKRTSKKKLQPIKNDEAYGAPGKVPSTMKIAKGAGMDRPYAQSPLTKGTLKMVSKVKFKKGMKCKKHKKMRCKHCK